MREKESKEIDGITFTVQQMGGKAASRLFVRLNAYLIPALAQVGQAVGKLDLGKGLGSDVDVEGITKGLAEAARVLFEKLTPDEYEAVNSQLLESATFTADGRTLPLWPQYDNLLAGKVLTGLKLFAFALQVNYRDFFNALGGLQNLAGAASRLSGLTTSKPNGPVTD